MAPKVLTLIMAGGAGSRMDVLTAQRAKPALPFAGVYRLIDFPLSNCMHSGLGDIWVIEQYEPGALNDHLAGGRPWDLDRTYGGLRVVPPFVGKVGGGYADGNADAIYRNRAAIRAFAPDLVLVVSADHVYTLDYRRVIDAHGQHNADVTLVTTQVATDEAQRFGNVKVDARGKVILFDYKPAQPRTDIATTEIFVYTAATLLDTLEHLAQDNNPTDGLGDWGNTLLPTLVDQGRVYTLPLDGYWRDVGTPQSYWQAHMDLLAPQPGLMPDDPHWPILTQGAQRMPARINATAYLDNSLIAPGCLIDGDVVDSVLGPGVVVERGARVHNSVVFHDTVIAQNATVAYAIIDSNVHIGPRAQVGLDINDAWHAGDTQLVLVGQRAQLAANTHIEAGTHVAGAQAADTAAQPGMDSAVVRR